VDVRQVGSLAELAAARQHLARRPQDVRADIDHQRRRDEIEHDGGDHDVAAAIGLKISRDERPAGTERHRRHQAKRDKHDSRQIGIEQQHRERRAEAGDIGLPFAADIEEAGVKGDRDRQPGEHEVGGVVERVADRDRVIDGAPRHDAHRVDGVDADDEHHQAGDQQGLDQVDDRHQADIDPARQ
jgi:hypothetical protein